MAKIFISFQQGFPRSKRAAELVRAAVFQLGQTSWQFDWNLVPGLPWLPQIRRAIEDSDKLIAIVVDETQLNDEQVLLAKKAIASEGSIDGIDWVVLESQYALQCGKAVAILNASSRRAQSVLPSSWPRLQMINLQESVDTERLPDQALFEMWKFLVPDHASVIQHLRNEAIQWANSTTQGRNSCHPDLLDMGARGSLALIGPPGIGKTQLLAQGLRTRLARDQTLLPFIVPTDCEEPLRALVARFASGPPREVKPYLQILRDKLQTPLVLVIDAFENTSLVSPGGRPDEARAALALSQLTDEAQVYVNCRDDFWRRMMSAAVSPDLPTVPLEGLKTSEEFSAIDPSGQVEKRSKSVSFLTIPLYADIAVNFDALEEDSPPRFFLRMFQRLDSVGESANHIQLSIASFRRELAALQLKHMKLAIPRLDLAEFNNEIEHLSSLGLVDTRETGRIGGVRFKHDSMDSFNIAHYLLQGEAWKEPRPNPVDEILPWRFSERILTDLAGMLCEQGSQTEVSRLLVQLIWYLDRKGLRRGTDAHSIVDDFSTHNWHVTYTLQFGLPYFKQHILDVLTTGFTPVPVDIGTEEFNNYVSRVGHGCTQPAASSLWSVFEFCKGSLTEQELENLIASCGGYDLLWRLYGAVCTNECNLGDHFLRSEIKRLVEINDSESIPGLIRAIANNPYYKRRSELLETLRSALPSGSPGERLARREIQRIATGVGIPRTAEEFFGDFEPMARLVSGRETYSDWQVVEGAARELNVRLRQGEHFPETIFDAVGQALSHTHEKVKASIVLVLEELWRRRAWHPAINYLLTAFIKTGLGTVAYEQLYEACRNTMRQAPDLAPLVAQAIVLAERADKMKHLEDLKELIVEVQS